MTSANIVTAYNNFARAQIDHDVDGRFDLPIYRNGMRMFRNFVSNFKGNAIYRSGFPHLLDFQDSAFMEFTFSQNQNYLLAGYLNKIRFASFDVNNDFGWVLDGALNILEVDTPYTLAETKEIAFRKAYTQNFDSVIVTHKDHEPYELKRIAANDFTFRPFARKDDPFPLTWAATKAITGATQATECVLTIVGHGYSVNDRIKLESVGGMTELNDWTAAVIEVVSANQVKIDIDTTEFTAYTSGGTSAKVLTGDYPDTCLYYKGRLYYGGSAAKITTVWASESGNYKIHTLPATVLATSAIEFTIAELDSRIEWMQRGQNSLIVGSNTKIVAVNGGAVGEPITAESIDTIESSADGCNNAEPINKDGFIFYISNDGRRVYYFNYDLLTETFLAQDSNVLAYDITRGNLTKIRYVKSREDLIYALRDDGALLTCNFNKAENIIGWHEHSSEGTVHDIARISDNNGVQYAFILAEYNGSYYIERQAAHVEFSQRKDFFTGLGDTNRKADDEAFYRKLAEELKGAVYLDNAETYSDPRTASLTYDSGAGTVTAGAASFVAGDVDKHIVFKTSTGYEYGRFKITAFNSTTSVDVEVLIEPTTNTYSDWYLTFSTVSGLTRFNGTTVSVVADGGYLDDFEVSGGTIDLDTQASHVVIGYKYRGEIESFPLGMQLQGENSQATMKAISRVGLRCHNTAGGKFGTSPYRLEDLQQIQQGSLNYLPPLPINSTKFVNVSDDNQIDKTFNIVQDIPLPMTLTAVMLEVNHAVTV